MATDSPASECRTADTQYTRDLQLLESVRAILAFKDKPNSNRGISPWSGRGEKLD